MSENALEVLANLQRELAKNICSNMIKPNDDETCSEILIKYPPETRLWENGGHTWHV